MIDRKAATSIHLALAAVLLSVVIPSAGLLHAQDINILGIVQTKGTIKSVRPGEVIVTDGSGKNTPFAIQKKGVRGISLGGAQAVVNYPAKVLFGGSLSVDALEPGTLVRFTGKLNRLGRTQGEVTKVLVFYEKRYPPGLEVSSPPKKPGDYGVCLITGRVVGVRNDRLTVTIPQVEYVRRNRLVFKLAEDVAVELESDDYLRATPGDIVVSLRAARFSTGDVVINELNIKLAGKTERAPAAANPDLAKYKKFSDEPGQPRDLRSANFILHTDLSDRSAKILLDKLETMISLVSQYYGRRSKRVIECYVVRDLKKWPRETFPTIAAAKIAEPAGVTISRLLGKNVRSIVYACDDHGVAQHESVHAYCYQTFGSTGPVWYSEGMAEVGNYWKRGQLAVEIDPVLILYLRNAPPKHLLDIVAANQITGDSWQAYTWRWALCHLLAFNPNYSDRFKGLGLALMDNKPGVSFESVYGSVAQEVSFEYDQFIQHVDSGYRADLCAWQWNRKFVPAKGTRRTSRKVEAQRGWQASGLRVSNGMAYDYVTKGTWTISETSKVDADGADDGNGKLIGVVMKDFQLSEPFELGVKGSFVAPGDGDLYLRCRDQWHRMADNDGNILVYLSRSAED